MLIYYLNEEYYKIGDSMMRALNMNSLGSRDIFKAITIASGGLSGGISSTIAGGNFWAGARQGLITSGINHGLHSLILGNSKYTFEPGTETAIEIHEIGYFSIDIFSGSVTLGKIDITAPNNKSIPDGLRRQKISTKLTVDTSFTANPDSIPFDGKIKPGITPPGGMRGQITFETRISGYNLFDFFKNTHKLLSERYGSGIFGGLIKGYDNKNNLIWSSKTKGGYLDVGFNRSATYNVIFHPVKYSK